MDRLLSAVLLKWLERLATAVPGDDHTTPNLNNDAALRITKDSFTYCSHSEKIRLGFRQEKQACMGGSQLGYKMYF
jgi:hypothetical protein